jgi:hypothetical protein
MTETELVTYLLANRHCITNRVFIACLALNRMTLRPNHRVHIGDLMQVLEVNSHQQVSLFLRDLCRAGLLEYESGVRGDPGYLITRIGPKLKSMQREAAREAHPLRR